MNTLLTRDPQEAARFVRSGGIAAFPTETVYGLGANIFDAAAVEKIFAAKGRPSDNPLIAHISNIEQVDRLASEVSADARLLIDTFFPGPLTVVLKRSPEVPLIATAGLDTVGVRMPANDTARAFLSACETPVAAPSANLSGRPSPTTWQAVFEDLNGRIDCILQGDPTEIGLESTVVDCTSEHPQVLRAGSVSLEAIRAIVPAAKFYVPATDEPARSPGLRHRHYSPRAVVRLIDAGRLPEDAGTSAFIGITQPDKDFAFQCICNSAEEYARRMFEFFRECDRRGIPAIYCETVRESGIGHALMDRLRRAAQ